MEALSGWTLALLRLLGALHWSWTWQHSLVNSYLNAAPRPLWLLDDQLLQTERGWRRQERQLPTAITIRVRSEATPAPPMPPPLPQPLPPPLPHRLPLPSHYVHKKREQRRRQPQSLPVFDSSPGDNALPTASYPIFVYNGSRGELLLNTMLSAQRYPMQEPVPGQVLYPPSTPMFRPRPIVERVLLPGQRQLLNLTLIPFYAHEAITAAPTTTTETTTATTATTATTTATSTTDPTASGAEPLTQAATTPMPTPYETQLPRSKRKRQPKKARQYSAYRSPQEVVQWQPTERSAPALEAPDNHRHDVVATTEAAQESQEQLAQLEAELDEPSQELRAPSEEQQPAELEASTSGDRDSNRNSSPPSFQIVYVDESMEAPDGDTLHSTTAAPPTTSSQQRQSSRYARQREYFAFPVYTLGKLLQHPKRPQISQRAHDPASECPGDDCSQPADSTSTWFIVNSRYKGPYRSGLRNKEQTKYYTSKYVQHPPR